jgi:hypothetical protein
MNPKMMHSSLVWRLPKQALKLLALIALLTGIASCAAIGAEPKLYFHSFSFNVINDAKKYGQPDVDVLDYTYGDSHQLGTRVSKEEREMSSVFNLNAIAGPMPRGEFLYVKWRVKATGEVYEDRVDLRHRLPADVTNYGIRFLIDGAQLYVFALPPYETKDVFGRVTVHGGGWVRDIYYSDHYRDYKQQHQIYPEIAKHAKALPAQARTAA